MSTSLFPLPMGDGPKKPHEPYWQVVDSNGFSVATGFETKHHAWRWIIGDSYKGPNRKWREPPKKKQPYVNKPNYAYSFSGRKKG